MRNRLALTIVAFGVLAAPAAASARLPRVPVAIGVRPQVRPYYFTTTADGSGYYGGRTGHSSYRPSPRQTSHFTGFGRLTWTSYTARSARATGIDWNQLPVGRVGNFPYRPIGSVRLSLSRPRHGIFTRLTVVETFFKIFHAVHGTHTYRFTVFDGSWVGGEA